jgi:hypothetical protein
MAIASATTEISSTFNISAAFAASQGTVTIDNPGRAFRILRVVGTGTAACVIDVKKNNSGGALAAKVTCDVNNEPMNGVLTTANTDFTADDKIFIDVGTQNGTQCDILCVATGGGQTLPNAVT